VRKIEKGRRKKGTKREREGEEERERGKWK